MSANNWTTCPRCTATHAAEIARRRKALDAKYGKVTVEEFDVARASFVTFQKEKPEETLREDYEIGISGNVFDVSYSSGCKECGFGHEFKHSAKVAS